MWEVACSQDGLAIGPEGELPGGIVAVSSDAIFETKRT